VRNVPARLAAGRTLGDVRSIEEARMSEVEFGPGTFPRLSAGELQVWRVELDRPPSARERLAEWLSPDERQRAERFVRDEDRQSFIVSHAALRTILAGYLGLSPGDVEMKARPDGKPELPPFPEKPFLRFNLTHSAGMAMVAVALEREVGVDVERVRPIEDIGSLVKRYFAPGEQSTWRGLPVGEQLAAFFRCWTRKEAYLKARGVGLSLGLDQFEVSLAPGEPPGLLWRGDARDCVERWSVFDVSPGGGFAAACVVEGAIDKVQTFDWSPAGISRPGTG
jgi:4'-phosphopantetheinyl transferase